MRFALLLLFLPGIIFGQEAVIIETKPTLLNFEKAMAIENPSDHQLDLILELTHAYGLISGDTCLLLAERALDLCKKNQNKRLYGNALVTIGSAYRITGYTDKCENIFKEARTIAESIDDSVLIGLAENFLGIIAMEAGNYENALPYFMNAASIFERLKDKPSEANAYMNIALLYFNLDKSDDVENYIEKASKITDELEDISLQMNIAGLYGNLYLKYGNDNKKEAHRDATQHDIYEENAWYFYEKSYDNLHQAYHIALDINDKRAIVVNLNNLVALQLTTNDYDQILEMAQEADSLAKALGTTALRIQSKSNLADVYLALGDYHLAAEYRQESLRLSQNKSIDRKEYIANKTLYQTFRNTGDYEIAISILEELHIYEKKIINAKRAEVLEEIKGKYESAKFENKILGLENNKKQRNLIIGGGLFFFILGLIAFQLNKTRKERNDKMAFAEALLFAQEGERKRIARDLHDGVGQSLLLMKKEMVSTHEVTQENQQLITDTLEEVRTISRDLHPIQLEKVGLTTAIHDVIERVEKSTDLFITKEIINLDEIFKGKEAIHIFRAIQEALNNIVKHAEATAARITIESIGKNIAIQVMDNGKGFDHELAVITSKSLGLRTMAERISSIGGKFSVEKNDPTGTVISFSVSHI